MKRLVPFIMSIVMLFACDIRAEAYGNLGKIYTINGEKVLTFDYRDKYIEAGAYNGRQDFDKVDFGNYFNNGVIEVNGVMTYSGDGEYYCFSRIWHIGAKAFYNTKIKSAIISRYMEEIEEYGIGWCDHLDENGNPDYPMQVPGFVIAGECGTYAERYAKANNIAFTDHTEYFRTGRGVSDKYIPGDFNGDLEVDLRDAQDALVHYVRDSVARSGSTVKVCVGTDVNDDDILDVQDAQLILKYYTLNTVSGKNLSWYAIRNGIE